MIDHCPTGGSSPHTRGAPQIPARQGVAVRIIPAYAGSTYITPLPSSTSPDHPRIRGEHLRGFLEVPGYGGSSPHTRGALPRGGNPHFRRRIIPAYAGSTPSAPSVSHPSGDHPRIRGEHNSISTSHRLGIGIIPAYAGSTADIAERFPDHDGSSPHTRGAQTRARRQKLPKRIIPAYAGSTAHTAEKTMIRAGSSPHTRGARPTLSFSAASLRDHPRIRGEHGAVWCAPRDCPGSSPHTRGARCSPGSYRPAPRIIPAYAGSTPAIVSFTTKPADHPRIRGEHVSRCGFCTLPGGSSPHTRGAPCFPATPSTTRGIIPAYAGSTPNRL